MNINLQTTHGNFIYTLNDVTNPILDSVNNLYITWDASTTSCTIFVLVYANELINFNISDNLHDTYQYVENNFNGVDPSQKYVLIVRKYLQLQTCYYSIRTFESLSEFNLFDIPPSSSSSSSTNGIIAIKVTDYSYGFDQLPQTKIVGYIIVSHDGPDGGVLPGAVPLMARIEYWGFDSQDNFDIVDIKEFKYGERRWEIDRGIFLGGDTSTQEIIEQLQSMGYFACTSFAAIPPIQKYVIQTQLGDTSFDNISSSSSSSSLSSSSSSSSIVPGGCGGGGESHSSSSSSSSLSSSSSSKSSSSSSRSLSSSSSSSLLYKPIYYIVKITDYASEPWSDTVLPKSPVERGYVVLRDYEIPAGRQYLNVTIYYEEYNDKDEWVVAKMSTKPYGYRKHEKYQEFELYYSSEEEARRDIVSSGLYLYTGYRKDGSDASEEIWTQTGDATYGDY